MKIFSLFYNLIKGLTLGVAPSMVLISNSIKTPTLIPHRFGCVKVQAGRVFFYGKNHENSKMIIANLKKYSSLVK